MELLKDLTSTPNNFWLQIIEIMELVDTLWVLNPKERKFTYWSWVGH